MNIQFEGSLLKEEFKEAAKLMNRRVLNKGGGHLDLWIALVALGGVLSLAGLRILFFDKNIGMGALVLSLGAVLFVLGMKLRTAVDRAWEESQKTDTCREGNVTDEYIEIQSAVGNSQILWTGLNGYGEYHEIILLFQGNLAFPFSSRFFKNNEEWQEFRNLVARKLPVTHKVSAGLVNSSNWFIWSIMILFMISILWYIFVKGSE